jgi:hypothetical protein
MFYSLFLTFYTNIPNYNYVCYIYQLDDILDLAT